MELIQIGPLGLGAIASLAAGRCFSFCVQCQGAQRSVDESVHNGLKFPVGDRQQVISLSMIRLEVP
ncbi:hypothetical protein [Pseudomonas pudica]|uniref:hypothetical protein n=1 Tax=Pseudomonas pudica TaxID=272772 RepID=UPI0018A8BF73|nr:hypothetical protein [Pseudomonas pudica]MBF8759620.1 hypothetical protein [Pseudomonas pudica]